MKKILVGGVLLHLLAALAMAQTYVIPAHPGNVQTLQVAGTPATGESLTLSVSATPGACVTFIFATQAAPLDFPQGFRLELEPSSIFRLITVFADGNGDATHPFVLPTVSPGTFSAIQACVVSTQGLLELTNRVDVFSTEIVTPPQTLLNVDPVTSPTAAMQAMLTGQAAVAGSSVLIEGGANPVTVVANQGPSGMVFTANVPLASNRLNSLFLTETTPGGTVLSPVPVDVIQDSEAPELFIDFPGDSAQLSQAAVTVAGRVSDTLSGFASLSVTVNGQQAVVNPGIGTNGTFELQNVALMPVGMPTTLTAVATDGVGNTVTRSISVTQVSPVGPSISAVSGDGQNGPVSTILAQSIEIEILDANAQPFAGKTVTFEVTKSNGRLGATAMDAANGAMLFQAVTDSQGRATAFWQLGSDAGCGNNRVTVSSAGVSGQAFFCASGQTAPAKCLNLGGGDRQTAAINSPLPDPLRVWVNDGQNGVGGETVTFEVLVGDGFFTPAGSAPATMVSVPSAVTGHAEIGFTLGTTATPQLVRASLGGDPNRTVFFNISAVDVDPAVATSMTGVVIDNAGRALENASVFLSMGSGTSPTVFTDAAGRFVIANIPTGGPGHLHVDGASVTGATGPNGSSPVAANSFPALEYEVLIVPNAVNELEGPAPLPPLEPQNDVVFDGTQDIVLTVDGIEGLEMRIPSTTVVTLANGTVASPGSPVTLSLNRVDFDEIPMPLPDGAAQPFAWTMQPSGTHFSPPIEVVYPNMTALAPGAVAYILSFNHDTSRFEIVSNATVSDDGSCIVSDAGDGISVSGWGGVCPPYPPTSCVSKCTPERGNGCGTEGGFPVPDSIPFLFNFTSACDGHDICYATPNASKGACDAQFFFDMLASCGGNPICQRIAFVYYLAVFALGGDAFDAAQRESEICVMQCQQGPAPFVTNDGMSGPVQPPTGWIDNDADMLPDDWETAVGLDPTDPNDAALDNDSDGLINSFEYIQQTDPFIADTDGNGQTDGEEWDGLLETLSFDSTFTAMLGGQCAGLGLTGRFQLPNVPIIGGLRRVTFVGGTSDRPLYAQSEFFDPQPNQVSDLTTFTVSETPLPTPLSISVTAGQKTFTSLGQTTQVTVMADMTDGSMVDVTTLQDGTTYTASNPTIIDVSTDGVVTALAPGVAFVVAINQGTTAVSCFVVSVSVPTTVEGFVQDENGLPVQGATVDVVATSMSTTTDGSGFFTIPSVPSDIGNLTVRATTAGGLTGQATGVATMPGLVTDAGIITVRPLPTPTAVYVNNGGSPNSVSGFSINANGTLASLPGSPFSTGGSSNAITLIDSASICCCGPRLYVTNNQSDTVTGFAIATNGSLTTLPGSPYPSIPGGLAIEAHEATNRVFVAGFDSALIRVYDIASDGSLVLAQPDTPSLSQPIGVELNNAGTRLYVTFNPPPAPVEVFDIASDGTLTSLGSVPAGSSSTTGSAVNSTDTRLYVPDFGGTGVHVYDVSGSGLPVPIPGSPFATSAGAAVASLSNDDQLCYVPGRSDNMISGYQVVSDGSLVPLAGFPIPSGGVQPSAAGITTDGTLYYVLNSATRDVAAFAIGAGGVLTPLGTAPLGSANGFPVGLAIFEQ